MTYREKLFDFVSGNWGILPERLWVRFPGYAVLRNRENRKWFALVMDLPREKLGLEGGGITDVVNVKLDDPLLADLLTRQPGYYPGYHIRRGNWITILLDGTVPFGEICRWVEESRRVTRGLPKSGKTGGGDLDAAEDGR